MTVIGDGHFVMWPAIAVTSSPGELFEKVASTRLRSPSGQSAPDASNICSKTSGVANELERHSDRSGQSSSGFSMALASSGESAKAAPVSIAPLPAFPSLFALGCGLLL